MKLLESAKSAAESLYAAYVLILVLGLRRGEALRKLGESLDGSEPAA